MFNSDFARLLTSYQFANRKPVSNYFNTPVKVDT